MRSKFSEVERINTIIVCRVIYVLRKYLYYRDEQPEFPFLTTQLTDIRLVGIALEFVNKDRYGFHDDEQSTLEHLSELALDDINFIGHLRGEINKLSPGEVRLIESPRLSLDSFLESHSVCPYTRTTYGVN